MNFGPQTASNWTIVFPPSVNSAFYFMKISRLRWRRPANGIQPHFIKQWTVGRANKLCGRKFVFLSPEKNWGQKLLNLFGFSTTSRLNGEYLLNEKWHRQSGKCWKVRTVCYVVAKFHELWSTNSLQSDRSLYAHSLFRFVPVHRTFSVRH